MPTDQDKLEADIRLVEAETEKIRAEIAKMEKESDGKKSNIGSQIIEGIKVLGVFVAGIGGFIAFFTGYQLSEINKKSLDLEIKSLDYTREVAIRSLDDLDNRIERNRLLLNTIDAGLREAKSKLPAGDTTASSAIKTAIDNNNEVRLKMRAVDGNVKGIRAEVSGRGSGKEKYYYVIAMTSADKNDLENEKNRIRAKLGAGEFAKKFPNICTYSPENDLSTLLIGNESLPYPKAYALKERAKDAGFGKDTWLWESTVEYFSQMEQHPCQ